MWQRILQPHVDAGRVVALGVVQEQHPDRATLYRQWRQLSWPVAVDALNELGLAAVPIVVAIDESGIVRARNFKPDQLEQMFLERTFEPMEAPKALTVAPHRDVLRREQQARSLNTPVAWQSLGDSYVHAGRLDAAVEAYRSTLALDDDHASTWFRLGVTLHRRSESGAAQANDAQAAVDAWSRALALDPNQYIWRRRLQQYGPRLDKPYDFYFWVEQARADIQARGELPATLARAPRGSEVAAPRGAASAAFDNDDTDSHNRIHRDPGRFVRVTQAVVPGRVRPGERVRVRWHFDLVDPQHQAKWNNEAAALRVVLRPPAGVEVGEGQSTWPNPIGRATSTESRTIEVELAVDAAAPIGRVAVPAYVLYGICENETGHCRWLRQDIDVSWAVDPGAVRLGR